MGITLPKNKQNEFDNTIDHITFRKYSTEPMDYEKVSSSSQANKEKKQIDLEHVTIERIFRISLTESDKFLYLEDYLASLLSFGRDPAFRIKDLDDIILTLFSTERKANLLDYLFETYHRSIEMIEKRFKSEYGREYKKIHNYLSNYICLLLTTPENFGIHLPRKDAYVSISKYLDDIDLDELGFFLYDIYLSTCHDYIYTQGVFRYYFDYIHKKNVDAKTSIFNTEPIRKHINILISIFEYCPLAAQAFVDNETFLPEKNTQGKSFQFETFLGVYLNISPYEANIDVMRQSLNVNKPKKEIDKSIQSLTYKLNEILNDVVSLIYAIYSVNTKCKEMLFKWIYGLISGNMDKLKLYSKDLTVSSNGFLLNVMIVVLRIFFEQEKKLNLPYSQFIFLIVSQVDPLFTLKNEKINFNKIERANPLVVNEILKSSNDIEDIVPKSFNPNTELFFIIHMLISFTIKTFQTELEQLWNKLKTLNSTDQLHKDITMLLKASECYINNDEIFKYLLQFCEATTFLIFSLNNKKYSHIEFQKHNIDYKEFLDDFYTYVNYNDNFAMSLLPETSYKNIITVSLFIANFHNNSFINNVNSTKAIVYFSLIFSSNENLIQNPHFRSEIFDIMLYLFSAPKSNDDKIYQLFALLKERYIKDSLILSIVKGFIDAERLGTSNQFYEKFSVRNKLLLLIDNINTGYKNYFVEKFKAYANTHGEECSMMVNLLMNDITYLNDEMIEKLTVIKQYEDMVDNKEVYNQINEEKKKFEEDKFKSNDRIVRVEIRLFNSSLKFLVSISKILQDNFLSCNLGEKLANLLNYTLDVFITKRGNKLKVKNLKEYEFNPKFILSSILSTYASFAEYVKFIQYIVKDERSYKYDNFVRAKDMVEESRKIPIDKADFNSYIRLVEQLVSIEKEIKSQQINYDDAPEEFLDQITSELMNDPVELPSSKIVLDRVTIETHLMSDSTDPFNRSKLTKEMLIPCKALKERIAKYIEQKKQSLKK